MAETILSTALERQVWVTTYFSRVRAAVALYPYMTNADLNKGGIILTKFQREEEAFRTINIPFIGRLKSPTGVTGARFRRSRRRTYELQLSHYCRLAQDGVRLPKSTTFRTEINLWNARQGRAAGLGDGEGSGRHHPGARRMCGGCRGTIINYDWRRPPTEHMGHRKSRPDSLWASKEQLFNHVRDGDRLIFPHRATSPALI